ncbi:hypothetical protein JCM9279_005279 [Rhodotorula babjevae]
MADTFETAIAHAASTWRTAALAARPDAREHIERAQGNWVASMQPLVDQFDSWTEYEQHTALEMMKEVVRRIEARSPEDSKLHTLPSIKVVLNEIDEQAKAYDNLRWIGDKIVAAFSRRRHVTGSARREHAARIWFEQGILSRVSRAEFQHESPQMRTGAIAELDWVRVELEQGRDPATGKRVGSSGYELLPGLSDLTHFHALNALLDDVDGMRRAAEAEVVRHALTKLEDEVSAPDIVKKRIQRTHDCWLKDISPMADDFFKWPPYFKVLFWRILDELVAVCQGRSHEPGLSGNLPTRDEMEHELKKRWREYDHVLWLGHEIADAFAGSLGSPNHDRRRRRADAWYQHSIFDRVSKAEWDSQRSDSRMGVVASLDATSFGFRRGWNWATNEALGTAGDEPLPDLAGSRAPDVRLMLKRVDDKRLKAEARAVTAGLIAADPTHQGSAIIEHETATIRHALTDVHRLSHTPDIVEKHNAIVEDLAVVRVEHRGSDRMSRYAHSLAHRSAPRSDLTLRQQVVYGRRLDRF